MIVPDTSTYELSPRKYATALEVHATELIEARSTQALQTLQKAKALLLKEVLDNPDDYKGLPRESMGKFYHVIVGKDLIIKSLDQVGPSSLLSLLRSHRRNLTDHFAVHVEEHLTSAHYFPDHIPDTLFYPDERNLDRKFTPLSEGPFLIQERIRDGVSIQEASKSALAESTAFRDSLISFASSYDAMSIGNTSVPDLSQLSSANAQVAPDGSVWLVDTNHLIHPAHNSCYAFHFIFELKRLIRSLEKGLVPGNPQG